MPRHVIDLLRLREEGVKTLSAAGLVAPSGAFQTA